MSPSRIAAALAGLCAPGACWLLRRRPAAFAGVSLTWLGLTWGAFCVGFPHLCGLLLWTACLFVLSMWGTTVAANEHDSSPARAFATLALAVPQPMALAALVLFASPMRLYQVPTPSMLPTLAPSELFVVDTAGTAGWPPPRGEVILFSSPLNPKLELVKRVIALPGEHVEVQDSRARINGSELDEPYLVTSALAPDGRRHLAQRVPTDHVYVLGDNRNHSADSRVFGFVPRGALRGRLCYVLWSPSGRWPRSL